MLRFCLTIVYKAGACYCTQLHPFLPMSNSCPLRALGGSHAPLSNAFNTHTLVLSPPPPLPLPSPPSPLPPTTLYQYSPILLTLPRLPVPPTSTPPPLTVPHFLPHFLCPIPILPITHLPSSSSLPTASDTPSQFPNNSSASHNCAAATPLSFFPTSTPRSHAPLQTSCRCPPSFPASKMFRFRAAFTQPQTTHQRASP